jgi:PAS domain S-box-containing protein
MLYGFFSQKKKKHGQPYRTEHNSRTVVGELLPDRDPYGRRQTSNPRSPSVLIVEDESIFACDIQQMLIAFGYRPFDIAISAEEAIARTEELRPDVVLMDTQIEGSLDGFATADLLRQRFDVPIIYITSDADPETIKRALETHPQAYLLKPVKAAELRAAIEIALYNHEMAARLRERGHEVEDELAVTYDRLRLAFEAGRSVGWDWDLKSGRDQWFGDLQTVFGIGSESYSGHVEDFRRRVHPEDRELVWRAVADAKQSRKPYVAEFRVVHADGTVRWIAAKGKFYYASNGDPERMLGMAVDITERRLAEEAGFRHTAIVESSDDAIISKNLDGVILTWNTGAQRMFGYAEEEVIGQPITIIIPPERLREENEILGRLRFGERIKHFETVRVSKDGRKFDVSVTMSPVRDEQGRIIGASKIVRDITESRRAEAALRESEERFRLVANTAPVMIWMSDVNKLCTYFNQPWLEFTGRSLDAEMGNGWTQGVHAEDLARCFDSYTKAFDGRETFQMEYRLRRHDGEYRWVLDSGTPRFNADGSFAGYIGSAIDVTERKRAEEALSTVSQRLIEAQEEERTWIARELHDDINQRVALLAVNLDRLKQNLPSSAAGLRREIVEASKQLGDLGSDIQALSHRLHSPKLEHLGLVKAAASLCKEMSDQQKVSVDFHSENIPKELSWEVSLCLFRVLQEALQNATKHSGSRHFQVSLSGGSNQIELTVQDSGVGFDPEEVMKGRGRGLASMKERLKLVSGYLSIDSQPQRGTVIQARVPLSSKTKSAGSAG